jgi:hypothetical protein
MVRIIEQEWARRRIAREWFPWPGTDAIPGNGCGIDLTGVPETGMLAWMGYHVGQTDGVQDSVRKLILRRIFEGELPPVHSATYMQQWGEPGSPSRLKKMAETIAALTVNEKRRRSVALDLAIRQRETDLGLLYEEYYVGKFDFGWPETHE